MRVPFWQSFCNKGGVVVVSPQCPKDHGDKRQANWFELPLQVSVVTGWVILDKARAAIRQ